MDTEAAIGQKAGSGQQAEEPHIWKRTYMKFWQSLGLPVGRRRGGGSSVDSSGPSACCSCCCCHCCLCRLGLWGVSPRNDRDGWNGGSFFQTSAEAAADQEQGDSFTAVVAAPGASGPLEYRVKECDTVRSIAAYFDVTPSRLKKFNRMSSDYVYPEQVVLIPQGPDCVCNASASAAGTSGAVGAKKKAAVKAQKEPVLLPVTVELSASSSEAALAHDTLKVPAKHITDSHGVVPGTLLITPSGITFDPDLGCSALGDSSATPETMFTAMGMEMISSATVYRDVSAAARTPEPSPVQPHRLTKPCQEIPLEPVVREHDAATTAGLPSDAATSLTNSSVGSDIASAGSNAALTHSEFPSEPVAVQHSAAPGSPDHQKTSDQAAGGIEAEKQADVDSSLAGEGGGGQDTHVALIGDVVHESSMQAAVTVLAATLTCSAADSDVASSDCAHPSELVTAQNPTAPGSLDHENICDQGAGGIDVEQHADVNSSQADEGGGGHETKVALIGHDIHNSITQADAVTLAGTLSCNSAGSDAASPDSERPSVPLTVRNPMAPGSPDCQKECRVGTGGIEAHQQAVTDSSQTSENRLGSADQVSLVGPAVQDSSTQADATGLPAYSEAAAGAAAANVADASAGLSMASDPHLDFVVQRAAETPEVVADTPGTGDASNSTTSRMPMAQNASTSPLISSDTVMLPGYSLPVPRDARLMPHTVTARRAPASEILYLCLRAASTSADNSSSFARGTHSYNQRKKPEHWFASTDAAKLESIYSFIIKWKFDTGECHRNVDGLLNLAPNVPRSTPEWQKPLLEVVFNMGTSKSPRKKNCTLRKEWEVTSNDEMRVTSTLMDAEKDLPLPPTNVPSSFLTEAHRRQLAQALPYRIEGNEWRLVYSTELHGFSLSQMYVRMRKLQDSPILLALQDASGTVFGALTSCKLAVSDHFYGTGESFLFTFANRFRVYSWTGENNLFIRSSLDNLWIGTGKGTFGLYLDGDLCQGRTQHCNTYNNDPLTGASEDFTLTHMEAWCFVH